MPVAAVGHYALAMGLYRQIYSVLAPVPQVIYPAATEMHAQNNLRNLENLYHKSSRLMMLIMIPVVLVAAFWAEDFYRLWIGEKYLDGSPFHSVATIFRILLIGIVTNFSSIIAAQIITGTGKVQTVAKALIFGSIISLLASLVLIRPYGLAGVASATVIASLVIDMIAMPVLLRRILGFSILHFLRQACLRPVIAGVLLVMIICCIRLTGHPVDFIELVLQGILAAAGSVLVFVAVGISREERNRYLTKPIQRLIGIKGTIQAVVERFGSK